MNKIKGSTAFNIFNYTLFIIVGILMLYPFWYVLMFSLSGSDKAVINNYYFLPNGLSFETYANIFNNGVIFTGYRNSIFVTVVGTALNLILTTMTAYPLALAKKLPGRNLIFNLIIFTMVFHAGMIPNYLVVKSLGMVDSLWALIIPGGISVFNLLIMVKFFKGIPDSLIESAKIDGYNDFSILIKIVLPLSPAVIAALGLFYAVGHWNDFLMGLIYINDNKKQVLQVILRSMLTQEQLASVLQMDNSDFKSPENLRMAAVIVTALPIMLVYPFLQKHFMKGIMLGSVKG